MVLELDLSRPIGEAPPPAGLFAWVEGRLTGVEPSPAPLFALLAALRHAAADERVRAVLVRGSVEADGLRSGICVLDELRGALAELDAAGKPVVARFERPGEAELLVGSAARELWVEPLGAVLVDGLAFELRHFARALSAFGLEVQVARAGRYKSAVEPWTRTSASPEAREQLSDRLAALEALVFGAIARGRGIDEQALRALAAQGAVLAPAQAVESGLVDREVPKDRVDAELARLLGESESWSPPRLALADYALACWPEEPDGPCVELVVLEGAVAGGGGESIDTDAAVEQLDRAREDEEVRAVCLRVNSPGGGVAASERLGRAVGRLAEAKPVVVSMSSLAASGGFWLAAPATEIVAHPVSATGSIGVFLLMPNAQEAAREIGVDVEWIATSRQASALSPLRRKDEAELARLEEQVRRIYRVFLERVASGRGLDIARLEPLAGGRVWTGAAAAEVGLVDRTGRLEAALERCRALAGLPADAPVAYPRPPRPSGGLALLERFLGGTPAHGGAPTALAGPADALLGGPPTPGLQARLPYDVRLR